MGIFGTIVEGSQTRTHRIRMLKQVLGRSMERKLLHDKVDLTRRRVVRGNQS